MTVVEIYEGNAACEYYTEATREWAGKTIACDALPPVEREPTIQGQDLSTTGAFTYSRAGTRAANPLKTLHGGLRPAFGAVPLTPTISCSLARSHTREERSRQFPMLRVRGVRPRRRTPSANLL